MEINAQLCINNGRQHSSIANKQIHASRGAELFVIVLQSKMVGKMWPGARQGKCALPHTEFQMKPSKRDSKETLRSVLEGTQ